MKTKAKGTWVILQNGTDKGVYYQYVQVIVSGRIGMVSLIRNGNYCNITFDTFNTKYRLAKQSEVEQHLAYLATKKIKAPTITIKGETPSVKFDPMKCEFYMVTCRGLRGAKVRHTSYDEAEKVAIELAKQENHKTWIVGVVASVEPVTKMIPQTTIEVKKK
jgi:hypothetical protein